MRGNKRSRWRVGVSRIMADAQCPAPIKEEVKKQAELLVLEQYQALVGRKAVLKIEQLQGDMIAEIQKGNNIDVQGKYAEVQALTWTMELNILNEIEMKERLKKRPNFLILKWATECKIELMKASSEIRKANESQHEMKHGKRSVNVNINDKESLEKWLEP